MERAVVFAQLGRVWWDVHQEVARKWMTQATALVELAPPAENPAERNTRLSTTRLLLLLIAPMESRLGDRLVKVLGDGQKTVASTEQSANAEALISLAVSVAAFDSKRALQIGALALRSGQPPTFHTLLFELRSRDPAAADQLFNQAIAVASGSFNDDFVNALRYAAFPELTVGNVPNLLPPELIRVRILQLLAQNLQRRAAMLANREASDCGSAVWLVAPVIAQFDQLQSEQAPLVRQLIRNCQEGKPPPVGSQLDRSRPQSVNDLLALADALDTPPHQRAILLGRAAQLAMRQKELQRAIQILDKMSTDEKTVIGMWDTWRRDSAVALALEYLNTGDLVAMEQVLKGVPESLRPFTKILLAEKLPLGAFDQTRTELLGDGRKGLNASSSASLEMPYWYFTLARLYAASNAAVAVECLRSAIDALNRSRRERPAKEGGSLDDLKERLIEAEFPTSLLETQAGEITEVIARITLSHLRARARLDLIETLISHYKELRTKSSVNKPVRRG
ncbi:MAG: hypothetical protein ACREBG_24095 [Pyrinomonadaceae bacterium]